MDVEQWAAKAEQEISRHEEAGREHAKAAGLEIRLEAHRSALKARLAKELLGTSNPATGRPHSSESAKDAAGVSEEYLEHVQALSFAVTDKNNLETEKYSARLRASLAIAALKAEAGVA